MHKRTFLLPALDGAIVVISFLITMLVKPGTNAGYISRYLLSFAAFIAIWVLISYWSGKYRSYEYSTSAQVLKKIIFTNFIIFCCTTALIYLSMEFNYSRFVVLGTLVLATMVELFIGLLYYYVRNSKNENGQLRDYFRKGIKVKEASVIQHRHKKTQAKYNYQARIDFLKNEIGEEAYNFIFPYGAIDSPNTLLIGATTRFTIDAQIEPSYECIINVNRVNDFRYINKFFEAVNSKLPPGGIFIDFFESKNMRKKRLLDKYPPVINYLVYSIDFLVNRVFPKFMLTKKVYFMFSKGENRVLSKAEAFGRLYSCGFEVLDEKLVENNMFFVACKVRAPWYPKNPSYGPLVALERIGKGGKIIKVYKMRTMHPYAEYLQEYIYKKGGLREGGKFNDDFRVTTLGRFMRMFWIDELPMLLNILKGELKIVGVRPLSKQYYKLYTAELQKYRIKNKPGLIPPFYVDYPKTLDEIMESELRYLKAYEKQPFITDFKYFLKASFNILFRRYRSK